ncbi:type ISP restriction/modification enzyme [Helicobacter ganmani]|uniref:type ISP restriction/modification enzyme n=2 Tax=Helicobacter ganmani TaxID=60246 RepID=UPI003A85770A
MLKKYLNEIQGISPQDKEHTYRTHLQNFLESLKESLMLENKTLQSLTIKHEPNNDKEGRGAPDFLIQNQGLIIGYIENKRVNADLDSVAQSPQIEKYLRLSDNLMLTDYLRFCLVRKNDKGKVHIVQEYRICDLSQLKATLKNRALLESKEKELTELFKLFFTHSPKPIVAAKEFANSLAQRTQILKDSLIEAQDNSHIISLYETFKEQLYKELDFTEFADSFAQTLTYSLFLARLNNTSGKEIDLYNAKAFIPKSFPLIRAMSGFLDDLEDLDSIKWLIEEILYIINHIDIISIIKELNKASEKDLLGHYTTQFTHKDPYLHFYETFLSQYDPRLREIRGVYYTPASVVSFIINAIDSILKTDFALKNGLGASLENDNITLLDFATGTGTFLLEAFRKTLESTPKDSARYEPKKLLKQFFGFEFLIAPYTIAHLKLSQSFKEEFNAPLQENESLNIRLTNTLYSNKEKDEANKQSNLFAGMIELAQEFKEAQKIKENAILIITGNPPYSGASANKGLFEDNVRITYGLEPSEAHLNENEQKYIDLYLKNKIKESQRAFKAILERKKLKNEKNPKCLLDDYVKFICFAESKIKEQPSGIFAFISNNSFLDNPTFRGMRYSLLKTFDTIYILDLHGNARKKECTPDGSKDENVFDIMQGVSINIFVKNRNSSLTQSLNDCGGSARSFMPDKLPSPHLAKHSNLTQDTRISRSQHSEDSNEKPQKLAQIHHYDLYGKRSDKTNFLYENTLDSIAWATLEPKEPFYLFIPQDGRFRDEYNKGLSVKDIFRVSSVGVVTGKDSILIASNEKQLESQVRNFYNEFDLKFVKDIAYRPFNVVKTYSKFIGRPRSNVMQHFLSKNIGLVYNRGSNLQDITNIFISDIQIDKHFVGANSYISPLLIYENENMSENFNNEFREFVDSKYNEHFAPEQILGYIYAVLFHKDYREKYIDFLKIDFPKIPFVESKKKFLEFSALGWELINTHLLQSDTLDSVIGEAKYKDTKNKNLKIEKIIYEPKEQKLFVNENLHFCGVNEAVWEYKIGGYQVLDKYLKSHKGEKIDHAHFSRVIQTLHRSLEIESQIAKVKL